MLCRASRVVGIASSSFLGTGGLSAAEALPAAASRRVMAFDSGAPLARAFALAFGLAFAAVFASFGAFGACWVPFAARFS